MLRTLRQRFAARAGAEVALAALVIGVVAMMIVPLPTWMLDILLATNLCLGLLLLSTALFIRRPLAFGAFPTLLLVTTLFRLALNVSSTRLILSQADAGRVIEAFGSFVVGGDALVGAVVFLVLTLVQFVVIARGSERVAEVGARFTLDAMPGKQLAIDADLRAGLIDADGARARRRELERESQFYGAMDGAMKFVKGDAVASLAITGINLLGGLAIGVLSRELEPGEALLTYGRLTIGDGLVSQIPALVISTAAGLVVTRVASEDAEGSLGGDIGAQLFGDWRALAVAALFAALLAVVPGLPLLPFAVLAAALGAMAFGARRRRPRPRSFRGVESAPRGTALEFAVGAGLASTLERDEAFADALAGHVASLYERRGVRLGAIEPRVALSLGKHSYEIRIAGVPVDSGVCPLTARFVEAAPEDLRQLDPDVRLDGAGGWVAAERAPAEASTGPEVLVARLADALDEGAAALVGLEETQRELDRLAREAPALVRAVVPSRLALPRLAALLRQLVAEGVSVRGLREILEAAAIDPLPADERGLLSTVRARLAGPISHALVSDDGVLHTLALDPMVEDALREGLRPDGHVALEPDLADDLIAAIRAAIESSPHAALLTQPDVRAGLRSLLQAELPRLPVLSYRELDPAVRLERLGVISP